jgi:hypothetical protein
MRIHTTLLLISLLAASGCAGFNKAETLAPVQCAIIGNTYAESPFLPPNVNTGKLISAMIKSNPAFTIHTGNSIYAGDSEGLREVDVVRQFDEQIQAFERVTPLKRVPGEFDLFNGNIAFYMNKTGSQPDYSFMYGKMLFIMLNSSSGTIQPSQLEWISSEIDLYDNISSIFVVTYLPLFAPKNTQTRVIKNSSALHDLFVKEEIKGVISGYGETLFSVDKNGIRYVNAGCVPVSKPVLNNQWHYYTVTLSNRIIDVQGKNW